MLDLSRRDAPLDAGAVSSSSSALFAAPSVESAGAVLAFLRALSVAASDELDGARADAFAIDLARRCPQLLRRPTEDLERASALLDAAAGPGAAAICARAIPELLAMDADEHLGPGVARATAPLASLC